jgi:thiol:disulfide interchange protein DsbD
LWALLAIGCGVYLGALDFSPRKGWGQLWKASGAASFVYGVLLLVGAASGADNPLRPLAPFAAAPSVESSPIQSLVWHDVKGPDGIVAALTRAEGRPAVLDLYADWCISCKVMERSVFPVVHEQLSEFLLLRADVTDNDGPDQALLATYGLFGPPSLLFFGPDGRELESMRIQGEVNAAELAAHLARVAAAVDETDAGQLARR